MSVQVMAAPQAMPSTQRAPRRRKVKLTSEQIQERYPAVKALEDGGERAWVAAFTARPEAVHALIGDFIKQAHAVPGRIGQRPMPKEAAVDFQAMIYGHENDDPLTVVLPRLLRERGISERAFCRGLHISRTQFQRILAGEHRPQAAELRTLAQAVKRPPAYFVEYRKLMILEALERFMDERPNVSTTLYRDMVAVRQRP